MFQTKAEQAFSKAFVDDGYVIVDIENHKALDRIRYHVVTLAAAALRLPVPDMQEPERLAHFLDGIAEHVMGKALNPIRLAIIQDMARTDWLRPAYFSLVRTVLEKLVGSEIAMQKRINLSIQLPHDESSLLPVHADVWSGDSPFEIVQWIPLVDCYASKSMYFLPAIRNRAYQAELARYEGHSAEDLYRSIESDLVWMEVPYGKALLFTQNAMHGNRINRETTTRWSMNCRFKGLFTPYADKRLGEFFEPITITPASRLGLDYRLPRGFDAPVEC